MFNKNKRGQIFVISIVIAITIALIASFILLNSIFEEKSSKEFLGSYESGIIDAIADGNKIQLYVDTAAKIAVARAFDEYIYGTVPLLEGEDANEYSLPDCGTYTYNLWNNEDKNCYPNYLNSDDFRLTYLINKHLNKIMQTKSDTTITESRYEDINLNKILIQDINYKYGYEVLVSGKVTNIYGKATNSYKITVFKNSETRNSEDIQNYVKKKNTYSGEFIWPLEDYNGISSCFGYRGLAPKGQPYQTPNHGALDIAAIAGTKVYAVASGTITKVSPIILGEINIDHGGGIKTVYMHLRQIEDGLKVGDYVKQGQVIGYVGGMGADGNQAHYGSHLHFEVISTNIDPKINYEGISAIVPNSANTEYKLNPLCFVTPKDNKPIDMTSTACNSICDKNSCANTNDVSKVPYKFCELYGTAVVTEPKCITSNQDNNDWKIISVQVPEKITSDNELEVIMTIENNGQSCINAKAEVEIFYENEKSGNIENMFLGKESSIYPINDGSKAKTFTAIKCKFSEDKTIVANEKVQGNCAVLMPSSQATYMVCTSAKTETKSKQPEKTCEKITVTKATNNNNNNINAENNNDKNINDNNVQVQLTVAEQQKVDATRNNLGSQAIEYIEEISEEYGIPKGILLGKITVESTGTNYKINLPTNKAIGISQVEGWQHYDTIYKLCGKEYVSECQVCTQCDLTKSVSKSCANDLANCCKFEKFGDDLKCQIKVGAEFLKEKYEQYKDEKEYSSAVKSQCKNSEYQEKYIAYTGWERALRAYNGLGCAKDRTTYVDEVLKYATVWGYTSDANSAIDPIVEEEIRQGIFGTYTITPVFNIKIDFDISLFDTLSNFAKNTISDCSKDDTDKKLCVDNHIKEFNNNIEEKYLSKNLKLTVNCNEETDAQMAVNNFVEEINNCMSSKDTDCNCNLETIPYLEYFTISSINSVAKGTEFTYYASDGKKLQAHLDYSIYDDATSNYWQEKSSNKNLLNIKIYKSNEGELKLGTNPANDKVCEPIKNKFKFCLNTDYQYSIYNTNTNKIDYKNIKIPFAITIRDTVPPKPVTGITSNKLLHDDKSIILLWNKNSETDVKTYHIYLSNSENDFGYDPTTFKQWGNVKTISLDLEKEKIEKYQIIKLQTEEITSSLTDYPMCDIKEENGVSYCEFKYDAIEIDGTAKQISLMKNILYDITDKTTNTDKYMYIIDGRDATNSLEENQDKSIVVTAIDIDGNEIDNKKSEEKIEQGNNLITIKPQNLLEPAVTKINNIKYDNTTKEIILDWTAIDRYIDNSSLSDNNMYYNIYTSEDIANCVEDKLTFILQSATLQTSTRDTQITIPVTPSTDKISEYCVYVTSKVYDNEYKFGFAKKTSSEGIPNSLDNINNIINP
jgi:murein DD-endopeptidase MepM/ murein hydrolase activator NlpD